MVTVSRVLCLVGLHNWYVEGYGLAARITCAACGRRRFS